MKISVRTVLVVFAMFLACCGKSDSKKGTENEIPSKQSVVCPDEFAVLFETTKGEIVIDVKKEWAENGAQRFYELVKEGYYEDVAFFRVIDGFIAQFGIHGNPEVNRKWRKLKIPDDPAKQSNTEGTVTFATAGPDSRTTQLFINYKANSALDRMGFAPIGKVRDMTNVKKLYSGYGEGAPKGNGPSQKLMHQKGNAYLKKSFPKLDYIEKASVID